MNVTLPPSGQLKQQASQNGTCFPAMSTELYSVRVYMDDHSGTFTCSVLGLNGSFNCNIELTTGHHVLKISIVRFSQ